MTTRPDVASSTPILSPTIWTRIQAAATSAVQGFLAPGQPLPGAPPLQDAPGPRVQSYLTGTNISTTGRPGLTPFAQLRGLVTGYSVAALCVQMIVDELTIIPWTIGPKDPTDKAAAERMAGPIADLTAKFMQPDGVRLWAQWFGMLLRAEEEIAMPAIYLHPARGGGVAALELVQGDTLRPIQDLRGETSGWRQIYQGVPGWIDPNALESLASEGDPTHYYQDWKPTELLVVSRVQRRESPWPIAPAERVLIEINRALRREAFDLAAYTDSNIPAALAGTPANWTLDQIQRFQEWFDTLFVGELGERRKIRFWPGDVTQIKTFVEPTGDTVIDLWLLKLTCAAWGVRPSVLGFPDDIIKETSEDQAEGQQRTGIAPRLHHWETVFTALVQGVFKQPDLAFRFVLPQKKDDGLAKSTTDATNIASKIYSAEYVRDRDGIVLPEGDPLLAPAPVVTPPALPITETPEPPIRPPLLTGPGTQPLVQRSARQTDLGKWQEKALARLRVGKAAACPFVSTAIPTDAATAIRRALGTAGDRAAVRAVFTQWGE